MTWKSHCVMNACITLALTGRFEVAIASMTTSALPDQIERFLPLGRHRGASHWLLFWLVAIVLIPCYLQPQVAGVFNEIVGLRGHVRHQIELGAKAVMFGLALGPILHVLLDGCSTSGVPVAPFSRQRLKLCLYKTRSGRRPWNVSEAIFLGAIFSVCAFSWKLRHLV